MTYTKEDQLNDERKKPPKGIMAGAPNGGPKGGISSAQFNRYLMQDRYHSKKNPKEFNLFIRGGRLSHEWFCSMHHHEVKMRLNWARNNQKQIRAERYQGLVDAQNQNDDLRNVGDRIVLPPSIELSPRCLNERYQGKLSEIILNFHHL